MKRYWGITIIEWVILLIIIITILIYTWCQLRAPDLQAYVQKFGDDLNWVSNEEFFKEAENGDLVFASGNTRGEKTCRACTGSIYSHVGLLFREKHPETGEEVLYIWDSDLGQQTKEGPRVLELKNKLERYRGYPYLMWRKLKGPRPSTEAILRVVQDYAGHEFDNKILTWWTSEGVLSPFYRWAKSDDKVFCSELVALTLQHEAVGMLDSSKRAAWYSPASFTHESIAGLHPNYSYGTRQFVKFHPCPDEDEDLQNSPE